MERGLNTATLVVVGVVIHAVAPGKMPLMPSPSISATGLKLIPLSLVSGLFMTVVADGPLPLNSSHPVITWPLAVGSALFTERSSARNQTAIPLLIPAGPLGLIAFFITKF